MKFPALRLTGVVVVLRELRGVAVTPKLLVAG
jgi:hypothetical protein